MNIKKQQGIGMTEVLVTLLVMTIGLLGVAGLMLHSMKTSHSNYFKTQAMFATQDLIGRMRSNLVGVRDGNYNLTNRVASGNDCIQNECTPTELAQWDLAEWAKLVGMDSSAAGSSTLGLPEASATVSQNTTDQERYIITINWVEKKGCEKNAEGCTEANETVNDNYRTIIDIF